MRYKIQQDAAKRGFHGRFGAEAKKSSLIRGKEAEEGRLSPLRVVKEEIREEETIRGEK